MPASYDIISLRGQDDVAADQWPGTRASTCLRPARASQAQYQRSTSPHHHTPWIVWIKEEQQEHQQATCSRLRKICDLRNHGESPQDRRHDYSAMAEDVAAFINDHRLRDSTVIGHSMGAKTAMTLALTSPELVANIIAVDNAPVDMALNGDFVRYIRGMDRIQSANIMNRAEADRILQNYEKSLLIRQFLLGNLHRLSGENTLRFLLPLEILAGALSNLGDFPYKNPGERRFEKPALFIRGTKSNYVTNNMLPAIGRFFPRFQLSDVDAGHWLISEQPESFRKSVLDFLRNVD